MSAVRCGRCGIYCEPELSVVAGPRCTRCHEEERQALRSRSRAAREAQRGARVDIERDASAYADMLTQRVTVLAALVALLEERGGV